MCFKRDNLNVYFILLVVVIATILHKIIYRSVTDICETEKCPYCFGKDFCDEFFSGNITLKKYSFVDLFANYIGTKNVFYAFYKNDSVVLKKLAHDSELNELDAQICAHNNLSFPCNLTQINNVQNYFDKSTNLLNFTNRKNELSNFKICSSGATQKFLKYFIRTQDIEQEMMKNIWTILKINAEPLIIQLLKSENYWPIPRYYGACGRLIVESYCGWTLNSFTHTEWTIRAELAIQLLQAVKNFTERHQDFRLYLTDVSPDNVAVSPDLKLTFIDLENIILTDKIDPSGSNIHNSINVDIDDGFAFSEQNICQSSISDHNYYAICKLLLSKYSPWPMMEGGLLHSAPHYITRTYPHLFVLIEECVNPTTGTDRFEIIEKLIEILLTASVS